MDWPRRLAIASGLIANLASVDVLAGDASNSGLDTIIAGPRSDATGQWRTKVQLVFEPATRSLTRRTYSVWDAAPSRDLDFTWQPADPAHDKAGRVNGPGHLVWRLQGKPAYDASSVVAEYSGTLSHGRLQGIGTYVDSAGLKYEGQWRDGRMDGRGTLQLPAGDEYVGQFAKGKAHGHGRLIDIAGEIYEGKFADGRKHGRGTTTLPNGLSYPSLWTEGQEEQRSRRVRIAQAGSTNLPNTRSDVRIGISVERRLPPEVVNRSADALWYDAANSPTGFQIRPANKRLLTLWRETGELQLSFPEEHLQDQTGVLSPTRQQFVPLNLRVELQNRSNSPIQMTGLYLDVQHSTTETKPAIQMSVGSVGACDSSSNANYSSGFTLENFGWGTAEGVALKFNLTGPQGGDSVFSISRKPGDLDRTLRVDIDADLKSMAVDTDYLKTLQGFACGSQAPGQCLNRLRATGKLGRLANFVQLENRTFVLRFASTLEYSWRDAKGNLQNWTHPFRATLPLGHIKPPACGAEGGGPQIVTRKAQQFKLDATGYKILISHQATVPPLQTVPLIFAVEAPRSSSHDFSIVIQLADGREIRSRPINLLYYRPRWTNQDMPHPLDQDMSDDEQRLSAQGLNGTELRQIKDFGDQCSNACNADARCLGYTQDSWNRVCSLKSQVTSIRHDPRLRSTLKKGIKLPIASTDTAVVERFAKRRFKVDEYSPPYLVDLYSNLDECEQRCKQEKDCLAFNFVNSTKTCFLIDQELSKPVPSEGADSGIKYQAAR